MNKLIDAFVAPINVTAEYVDRISKGDIPPKITDTYNGDFNEIKNNLNACIEVMSGLLRETNTLIKATQDGKLQTRGNAEKFAGGWGELVGGVNKLIDAFVAPINVTAEYVDRISKGDIPPKITDTYNGDFNEIKNNLNACIDVMNGLLQETNTLIKATQDGKLQTRGNAEKFAGGWGELVGGVNNLIEAFVAPIKVTADYVDRISKGAIPPRSPTTTTATSTPSSSTSTSASTPSAPWWPTPECWPRPPWKASWPRGPTLPSTKATSARSSRVSTTRWIP